MGHALTRSEYRKRDELAKERAAVLKEVAQCDCNQLPKEPNEPQPGPYRGLNGTSHDIKGKHRDRLRFSSDEEE